jgi:hypothetical protein
MMMWVALQGLLEAGEDNFALARSFDLNISRNFYDTFLPEVY